LLNLAGVVFRQFVPTNKKIVIDFDVINSWKATKSSYNNHFYILVKTSIVL
jgi:hypothetical protein